MRTGLSFNCVYCQISLQSHLIQHPTLYNNTHVGNRFTVLCTQRTDNSNNLVIAACCSRTNGVVVKRCACSSSVQSNTASKYSETFLICHNTGIGTGTGVCMYVRSQNSNVGGLEGLEVHGMYTSMNLIH